MTLHSTARDRLLEGGPRLPPPAERRRLRELWGADFKEVADVLGVSPATMAAWEAGLHAADTTGTRAYLQLLNAFREQLDAARGSGRPELPEPPEVVAPPTATGIPAQAAGGPAKAKPARRGTRWSSEERECLRTEFLRGTSVQELAESLKRSEKSVRWALYHLGLIAFPADEVPAPRPRPEKPKAYTVEEKRQIHPRAYERWSADEEQRLAERCAQGASLAELSVEFGRNEGGIAGRLIKINAEGAAAEEAWEYGG
ncbi:hypothetical protein AB0D74_43135 [Streptomyces sp. NPDC048278]|uniref:hypothetical protein n=1 Tax=Streptomyces sp. NPDC048278 TaxID=3155809 RepID=UPI0034369090